MHLKQLQRHVQLNASHVAHTGKYLSGMLLILARRFMKEFCDIPTPHIPKKGQISLFYATFYGYFKRFPH